MDTRSETIESLELEGKRLKEEVELLGPRSPSRRYSEELRQRIVRWAQAQRSGGERVTQIAVQVGIPWESLSRWMKTSQARRSAVKTAGFRPVTVIKTSPSKSALVLRSNGFCVEGLDLAGLADLLRQLR